jgi:ATP-dependent 26S proteasome regulatory subunit
LNLPFRRGYLFHGKPGNGKTSVVRAMLSRAGVRGFTMNFFGPHIDDDSLQSMFDAAAERAPAIIVMEDIDRAFPKTRTTPECNVSLQQLLNCLDGVGTQDGVVVVATANDPSSLDPAILRRPGRFDRVVCFPNPSADLRLKYLQRLNARLEAEQLSDFIRESEGMSFAQLREVYILAGQAAFDAGRELTVVDVNEATKTIKEVFSMRHEEGVVGFAADYMPRAAKRKRLSALDEVPF